MNAIAESHPTSPRVSIEKVVFSDGTSVELSPSDVVLIVGPNNAGKSATLRAIRDKIANATQVSPVIERVALKRTGSIEDVLAWVANWTITQVGSNPGDPTYMGLGHSIRLSTVKSDWQRGDNMLGGLARWFCHHISADERLQLCNPPGSIALARDNPSHPFHYLQRDDALERRVGEKFKGAFGVDLIVHRNAGNRVPVHVGDRPELKAGEDRVSLGFIERLEQLPMLHEQGDGMRSFAGVLLATSVGRESVMLIDEPEAFLHPPQARLLGRTLVADKAQDSQLLIATHSTDILRGVLDIDSPQVKVLRIRRSGQVNTVRLLSNSRVQELWSDPLLRYSNILDGLFHEGVVVCEADSDCRFYSAMLEATNRSEVDGARRPDLMFTHCGGKHRLSMVVSALREVDVPVKVVADFDVLSEARPLRDIVLALGGDWEAIEQDWRSVKSAIDSKKPELDAVAVRREIEAVFEKVASTNLPEDVRISLTTILKRSSAWAYAKDVGKAFVPPGDPTQACNRLLATLRTLGLFVVEVGELEGFARSVGRHGPQWVNGALQKPLATDPELQDARAFVAAVASAFNG